MPNGGTRVGPRVSLIVCTRNRGSRLGEFLNRITQLDAPSGGWELILVDNASTDATPAIIEEFVRTAGISAQYVYAPLAGLARARNAGIAAASGDVLAFTDDDCYPQTDYLKTLVDIFSTYQPGFVGGRVLQHNPDHARVTLREYPNPLTIEARSCLRPGRIHGANMAVLRDVVHAIGGFDPHLGAGTPCIAGEDTEFLARALWAGWSGRYDPALVVSHDHGRLPAEAARMRRGYHFGCGAYFMSCVLRADARRAYLAYWCRWIYRYKSIARFAREVAGASRYVLERTLRPEPVPRFDGGVPQSAS
jgi:glycosyltransferase involved in cell wall biosynthesis